MAYISEIRLSGPGKQDAFICFNPGPNVVAGDSDTGKSYLLRCADYVLGAKEMTKVIEEASGYELVRLELTNRDGSVLTLERHLSGGDVRAYSSSIEEIIAAKRATSKPTETSSTNDNATQQNPDGEEVLAWKRQGTSKSRDVTSRILPFVGMPEEIRLRSDARGQTQRLTIRTLLPVFLLDETTIISEQSLIIGEGFAQTPRKRMFSYLLTGTDDSAIIAQEKREIAQAEITAKLALVDELLAPIEKRLESSSVHDAQDDDVSRIDETIESLSNLLSENEDERANLREQRREQVSRQLHAESQIIAIDELLSRYDLLNERYLSDLDRLDFIAEGAHFFDGLQDSTCPLCGQTMDGDSHAHEHGGVVVGAGEIHKAASAEAAKIQGLQRDLQAAILDLQERRKSRDVERQSASFEIEKIDKRLDSILSPTRARAKTNLDELVQHRLRLQIFEADRDEANQLRMLKNQLNESLPASSGSQKWAPIDSGAVTTLCRIVEALLIEWSWPDGVRVEFDDRIYDIKVDGKPRRSHGKGFRAVLNSALAIGILEYCRINQKPHPGFVILDSPLTTVKQRDRAAQAAEDETDDMIDPRIEPSFWQSLAKIDRSIQVIVLDNKEPSAELASRLNLQIFAGPTADAGERKGFIPK
mgnify:CR=1 FL=1